MSFQTIVLISEMLLLPPPLSKRVTLAAIARRRGISTTLVAAALGITKQGANQLISKFEKYHGSVLTPLKTHRKKKYSTRYRTCPTCKIVFSKRTDEHLGIYCSQDCFGASIRILSREEVVWVINQRHESKQTWTGISKSLGIDVQTVQSNVWLFLISEHLLRLDIVEPIWRTRGKGRPGAWKWLVDRTGKSPAPSLSR